MAELWVSQNVTNLCYNFLFFTLNVFSYPKKNEVFCRKLFKINSEFPSFSKSVVVNDNGPCSGNILVCEWSLIFSYYCCFSNLSCFLWFRYFSLRLCWVLVIHHLYSVPLLSVEIVLVFHAQMWEKFRNVTTWKILARWVFLWLKWSNLSSSLY